MHTKCSVVIPAILTTFETPLIFDEHMTLMELIAT